MSKGNTFENDFLKLVFNATGIANIADNASTSPLTSLYIGLHTADPGEGGSQTTSEASYTGYARIGITRASGAGGWTVSSNTASNTSLAQFAECTAGSDTITHVSIGTDSSGAGKVIYSGALNASRGISAGIQPQFAASALTVTED